MDRTTSRAIEWDCTQLVHKFFGYLDEKRYEDMANLFADDGAWVRLGKPLVGKDNILATMQTRELWLTAHVVTNVRVEIVDATHARTVEYITLYRHEGWDAAAKGPAPVVLPLGVLCHTDEMVRVGDEWKLQRKSSRAIMVDRVRVPHYD